MSSAHDIKSNVLQAVLRIIDGLISREIEVRGHNARLVILKKLMEKSEKPEKVFVSTQADMAIVGGRIAFDFKSVNEFDSAAEAAKSVLSPNISYYVLTDWDNWRIYRVTHDGGVNLRLVFEGERDTAMVDLENLLTAEIGELKVSPNSDAVADLFSIDIDELKEEMKRVLDSVLNDRDVASLFEAYKKIIKTLYPGEDLNLLKDLYVRHTLMHMMVMASLSSVLNRHGRDIDICSGSALPAGLNAALPYLNWWKIAFNRMPGEHQEAIKSIASNIVIRARMIDWSLDVGEDVFRALYQFLIDENVRRKIGEYYTPSWLADKIISEFSLKDKIVMDPFCGSGTFLVKAFHKKLEEGEDVDKVYGEVVGFDINPLAVAVARAELIISYVRAAPNKKLPDTPPRVYHTDTLSAWFSEDRLQHKIAGLLEVQPAKMNGLFRAASKMESKDVLDTVSKIEYLLAAGISAYMNYEDFEEMLTNHLISNLRETPLEMALREMIMEDSFIRNLASLVKQYGDGVWAAAFSSLMSPILLNVIKPHVIATNPPWIPVTEYKSSYTNKIHETFRRVLAGIIGVHPKRAASIATGSDVASGALYKSIIMARDGVGFVMSKTQSFNSKSPVYAGIVTTYAVLKSTCADCFIKLVDVQHDVFGHGMEPALVITKKGEKRGAELYLLVPEDETGK